MKTIVEIVIVSFKFLLCSFLQPGQLMVGALVRKLTPYMICSEHRGFPHRAQVAVADFPYLFIGFGSGIMDYMYLREFKHHHVYILLVIRPISILIFFIFVPVPPFPVLGGTLTHIFFILLFGVITLYIRQLVMVLSKFYKNSISLYSLVMFPFIIFFMDIFFRIV